MATCAHCERYVDTDDDPEFFCIVATYANQAQPVNASERDEYIGLCGWCREGFVDENGYYWANGVTL